MSVNRSPSMIGDSGCCVASITISRPLTSRSRAERIARPAINAGRLAIMCAGGIAPAWKCTAPGSRASGKTRRTPPRFTSNAPACSALCVSVGTSRPSMTTRAWVGVNKWPADRGLLDSRDVA